MQIVHCNVHIDIPAGGLNANHQRFRVGAASQPGFVHVNLRREHFKVKSLIVQQRHGIADDHVSQLAGTEVVAREQVVGGGGGGMGNMVIGNFGTVVEGQRF